MLESYFTAITTRMTFSLSLIPQGQILKPQKYSAGKLLLNNLPLFSAPVKEIEALAIDHCESFLFRGEQW
jgi:hypothetical protein